MADNDDNVTKQAEEVEALAAIYDEAFRVVDEGGRIYRVEVSVVEEAEVSGQSVSLQVEMPPDYPRASPPLYQLNAPWLRGDERASLEASLQDIYCENLGESIVYLWVEKIREFLSERRWAPSGSADTADTEEGALEGVDQLDVCVIEEQAHGGEDLLYPCPEIHHGEPLSDRRSKFVAHLAQVIHKSQVQKVLDKLKENRKIADATHNIYAYRISQGANPSLFYMGCEDDGETKAGSRLLHLLQTVDARDVIVVVTRWYGGVHLGPDRFKHISSLARNILENCGYIKDKAQKKGPKSSVKKSR